MLFQYSVFLFPPKRKIIISYKHNFQKTLFPRRNLQNYIFPLYLGITGLIPDPCSENGNTIGPACFLPWKQSAAITTDVSQRGILCSSRHCWNHPTRAFAGNICCWNHSQRNTTHKKIYLGLTSRNGCHKLFPIRTLTSLYRNTKLNPVHSRRLNSIAMKIKNLADILERIFPKLNLYRETEWSECLDKSPPFTKTT